MASATPTEFNFEELVTPAELKVLGAKEKGIFFTQEMIGEGEKKNNKDKKKLCISNKRLYLLNTQGKTPKLDLSLSLLAISGLTSPSPEQITLSYILDPHSDKTKQVKLEVTPEICVDALAAILSPLHSSLGRDGVTRRLKVKVQGEGRQEKLDGIVDENVARVTQGSQAGAVSELYALLCDFLEIPFHDEIAWDLENTYQTHSIRTLSLGDFSQFSTRDLVPLIRTLEFCPRFEGLHADGLKLCSESIDAVLHIAKHCPNLRNLTLRAIPALNYKLMQKLFTQGFLTNQHCVLENIDLTDTVIEDKGLEALVSSVQSFPLALKELKLGGTGFSSKGFSSLSKNLLKHTDTYNSLSLLDLSNNHFSSSPSDLQAFLSLLATENKIQQLSLAATNVPFDQLFSALQKGSCAHLCCLDLSGNSKPAVGKSQTKSTAMKEFLCSAASLKQLNLANCKLSGDVVLLVLEALKENSQISELSLDLSQNDLSTTLKEIATALSAIECITCLDLSQTGLDSDYRHVIVPILQNRSLRSLDLSGNMKRHKSAAAKALEECLMDKECSLHSLKLKDCRLGDHMNFVLRALISNDCLKQLDLTSNQMGPPCFRQLARLILNNCSLESVFFDENLSSVGCFSGLTAALENNFSICEMPIPYRDMPRLRKEGDKELETALSKISQLLTRNQSPLKREHALAAIRRRVQLFLAEQQLLLDKKIVQLDEEIQQYDPSRLDEGKREVVTRANNLAAKAGLLSTLCENFYSEKIDSAVTSRLSEIVSDLATATLAPEVRTYRDKLVAEMLEKLDYSLSNAVSKQRLEEIRTDISQLPQPSFLTEELLALFSAGLSSGVTAGNLSLAEQLIAQTCELVASELDSTYQQVCNLETEDSPKSPDRVTLGGTCRMKLAFSQSMKRHRVSYQTFNPQFDPESSDDLDETQPEREHELTGELEIPVPTILETSPSVDILDNTPPIDQEEPSPETSEAAASKSAPKRSAKTRILGSLKKGKKDENVGKKGKSDPKITRTGSATSTSSQKTEQDLAHPLPDLTAFEDLSKSATRAPELIFLKSKPKGPSRRPPRREQREQPADAPEADIFAEIAATVVPGLDQMAPPVSDEPGAEEGAANGRPSASEDKPSVEPLALSEDGLADSEEGGEKKQPPPTSPRRIPSGQTTPGPANAGLASVLLAGLGKSKVKASKSQENLLEASKREEMELVQKKSYDFLSKPTDLPSLAKPKPRPRPASVFKPVEPETVKEGSEELKLPPIATKRHTMEDKTAKPVDAKEEAKASSSEEKSSDEHLDGKEPVKIAEKKVEESGENLPVSKPENPGIDGEIKKSPSVSRKPILPKPMEKPLESKKNEVGENEVKKPPVAGNKPKPTTIKPQKPIPTKSKPKLGKESPEKAADATEIIEKIETSEVRLEEEKEKAASESSSEPQTTEGGAEALDTSTTSSDAFEDASETPPVEALKEKTESATSPLKPPHLIKEKPVSPIKPGSPTKPLTPTKPVRTNFGKSQSSEDGVEVTSPKLRSPRPVPISPSMSSPILLQRTDADTDQLPSSDIKQNAEKATQQSPENTKELATKLSPGIAIKERESWVVISDDEGEKEQSQGNKDDAKTESEVGSSDK